MTILEIGKANLYPEVHVRVSEAFFYMDVDKFVKEVKEVGYVKDENVIFPIEQVLIYAIFKDIELFEFLFEEGLTSKYEGKKLLFLACEIGNYNSIKMLLEKGFDINSTDKNGQRIADHSGMVPPKEDRCGDGILSRLYIKNESLVVNFLKYLSFSGYDLKKRNYEGGTFLHELCNKFREEYLELFQEFLVEASLQGEKYLKELIEIEDYDGNTALILASKNNKLRIVKELLRRGANKEHKNHNGNTFLSHLYGQNKSIIEEYIELSNMSILKFKKGIPRKD